MSDHPLNVFISSLSKKVPLAKAVRKALEKRKGGGKIVGGDVDKRCIGRYFVDSFWEMPPLDKLTPDLLISYLQEEKIDCVIPTRDGELLYFAALKERLKEEKIHVMVSDPEQINLCIDKFLFYQTVSKMGFLTVETALQIEDLEAESFVVKEQFGAGGRTIGLNLSKEEAKKQAKKLERPIFQPFIRGEEVSLDLYLDLSGNTKGTLARNRDLVVNGESQVTTSFQDRAMEEMCTGLAEKLELYGHVMFQLIKSADKGAYYILECNPRFGGASTLSLEMGLDSFFWFFLESEGEDLATHHFHRSEVEKKQVRYSEDLIIS